MNLQGTWVWVTGASSGLGRELARQLALDHKANLVISARRADRLEALKVELEAAAGVQVRIVVTDLTNMDTSSARSPKYRPSRRSQPSS